MTVEPKRTHLTRLHNLLASFNDAIMSSGSQINSSIPIGPSYLISVVTACSGASSQLLRFTNGQIISADGYCLVATCSDCYPASFAPCSNDTSQQFQYNNKTFALSNVANGLCLDIYAGLGVLIMLFYRFTVF
jgi:hypothetical protein